MIDVSFVIPVKIDTPERSRNLDLVIALFLHHFDSPIFVLEADEQRRYFPKNVNKRLHYQFAEDKQQGFYHTKYLNRLYGQVDTPIMAIWDTDIIVSPSQIIETNGRIAVGGGVLVDRVKYLQAGGENEYFTDWGPEDLERVKRIEILYHKPIYRYEGYLFHLWHPRHNSQYNDPQKEILFKQEYLRICGMTQKELKAYVAGWPSDRLILTLKKQVSYTDY